MLFNWTNFNWRSHNLQLKQNIFGDNSNLQCPLSQGCEQTAVVLPSRSRCVRTISPHTLLSFPVRLNSSYSRGRTYTCQVQRCAYRGGVTDFQNTLLTCWAHCTDHELVCTNTGVFSSILSHRGSPPLGFTLSFTKKLCSRKDHLLDHVFKRHEKLIVIM